MFTANVPSLQHTIISYSCTSEDLDQSTTKQWKNSEIICEKASETGAFEPNQWK